jgi:hypothetical protein
VRKNKDIHHGAKGAQRRSDFFKKLDFSGDSVFVVRMLCFPPASTRPSATVAEVGIWRGFSQLTFRKRES